MISAANLKNIFLLICSLLLAGCFRNERQIELKELKGEIFGSYYLIKYRGNLETSELQLELNDFFKSFNDEFSTYQPDSVISKFNQFSRNSKFTVSSRFIDMLKMIQKFHSETEGAFDPTLAPVIKAWGFGGGKGKKSEPEIKEAFKKTGFKYVKWDEEKKLIWKEMDGIELDVNAFAPGWAADLIGEILHKHHIYNYMVDISGEILFKGMKTDKDSWIGGIETPSKEYAQGIQKAFRMKDLSMATSGNYRQFFDENGKRRSHIIDPRTGKPVEHKISSATVIANSTASADAWSTAMMVLGPLGVELCEKYGMKVLLLEAKKLNEFQEIKSHSMDEFIKFNRP